MCTVKAHWMYSNWLMFKNDLGSYFDLWLLWTYLWEVHKRKRDKICIRIMLIALLLWVSSCWPQLLTNQIPLLFNRYSTINLVIISSHLMSTLVPMPNNGIPSNYLSHTLLQIPKMNNIGIGLATCFKMQIQSFYFSAAIQQWLNK